MNRGGTPRLAVTLGDPRGIGPEVVDAALSHLRAELEGSVVVLGPEGGSATLGEYRSVGRFDGSEQAAGAVSVAAVAAAVDLASSGSVDGVVTGPIHKPALRAAGYAEPGHTELLGRLTGADEVGMLMHAEAGAGRGPLRVLLATTHVSLREVPNLVTSALLVGQTRLLDAALRRDWRIEHPRLALCALNPHASDSGLFGSEEADIYGPALEELESRGVEAVGPVPADTVFTRALRGEFDAVVAPYHDVGMAAFKTASFGSGVNVTLGLPFPRTSPDHGTAFDLVGRGRADPSSMIAALTLALRLARGRRPF